jgi:hypothetical protein
MVVVSSLFTGRSLTALASTATGCAGLLERTIACAAAGLAVAAPFKNETRPAAQQTAYLALALGALGKRLRGNGLLLLEPVAAGVALVFICGHLKTPILSDIRFFSASAIEAQFILQNRFCVFEWA